MEKYDMEKEMILKGYLQSETNNTGNDHQFILEKYPCNHSVIISIQAGKESSLESSVE